MVLLDRSIGDAIRCTADIAEAAKELVVHQEVTDCPMMQERACAELVVQLAALSKGLSHPTAVKCFDASTLRVGDASCSTKR